VKIFAMVLSFGFLSSVALTTTASADSRMTGQGNCSGGACKAGTSDAYDIRYCSKANCRKSKWKGERPPQLAASFIA
jgi:hypothetical protein